MKKLKIGVVDFFSGCGGASTGFAKAESKFAETKIILGIDIDSYSCETFRSMHNAPAWEMDILDFIKSPSKISELKDLIHSANCDKLILIGCSPCQGFAAHRKSIKGTDSRRSLFAAFCQIAGRLSPDAIFIENVPDMFSKKHWSHFCNGRDYLQSSGYKVGSRIFNFAGFGLPQERFRAVVMAFKKSFQMPTPFLNPGQFRTVRDAIGHLPSLEKGRKISDDPMHITSQHRQSTIDILKKIPKNGGNRPVGVGPKCLDIARINHGGYTDVYGRLSWDKPSVTITARCRTPSCGRFAHPEENRGLSIREAALLQGFPPEFVLEGPFDDKYKQIGNAVPPLVAKYFAEHMITMLTNTQEFDETTFRENILKPVGPGFAVKINGIKRQRKQLTLEEAYDAA